MQMVWIIWYGSTQKEYSIWGTRYPFIFSSCRFSAPSEDLQRALVGEKKFKDKSASPPFVKAF